jgi:hypothetical protein
MADSAALKDAIAAVMDDGWLAHRVWDSLLTERDRDFEREVIMVSRYDIEQAVKAAVQDAGLPICKMLPVDLT